MTCNALDLEDAATEQNRIIIITWMSKEKMERC
jgi:hypothetical protein